MSKILVVDDDPLLLDLLLETLQTIGYDPIGASGGEQALELLDRNKIELVISDIKMPGMSGIELARQVRQINQAIPIIFITGVYDPTHLQEFKPDGFLAKPFRINQIEQLIKTTLANKRSTKPSSPVVDILVVDDDDSFRVMLIEALKLFGYRASGVSNAIDARRQIKENNFSVIVTDIKLSHSVKYGGDGRTLAREIKNSFPDISIILISAYLQNDPKIKTGDDIAEAVLLKPFKIEEIIEILDRLSSERKRAVGHSN